MEPAWEALWASASLMAMEQQVLASWVEWVQMAFASLADSVASELFWWRAMPNSKINFCQWASMEDLIASRSPRTLLASSQRWATSVEGASPLGPRASTLREEGVGLPPGRHPPFQLHWGCSPGMMCPLAGGNLLVWSARGVTRTFGFHLLGVELPDVCSDVSKTAWDRRSLTSVVMLTSPSTYGRGGWMGLAIKLEGEWLLRGWALSSGPSTMDCGMSTFR